MLASFQAELLVLRRWPAAWVIVLLGPFVTLLFDYAIEYVLYLTAETGTFSDVSPDLLLPALLPGQFVIVVTNGFGLYGTATAVVLGALVAGGDWGRGTLKTALVQRPTRLATFAGQALAVFAALAAGALASFAIGAAFSLLVSALEAGAASPEAASFPAAAVVAKGVGVALLISVTYGAFGLALGTLFRGAGLAIGVALLLAVVVQALLDTLALQVRGAFEAINDALPGANVLTLTGTFGAPGGGPDTQVLLRTDPAVAAWVLVGYAVAFLALGAILLLRRDVA